MAFETGNKVAHLICFGVVGIAVTGYFIGMKSPMNPAMHTNVFSNSESLSLPTNDLEHNQVAKIGAQDVVLPATAYSDMGQATKQRAKIFRTNIKELEGGRDLMATVTIAPEQKSIALAKRGQNRSFNGAPPTIPHPVDNQMSVAVCVVCHSAGTQTATLRIPRMSHQFLSNCTQCHVENAPTQMEATLFRENTFVGKPAPQSGKRAYKGAPPEIPHSTWMRVDCMSCHGLSGLQGIRSTHPWRANCQQCHAPSSKLNQVPLGTTPKFLPPPVVDQAKGNNQ